MKRPAVTLLAALTFTVLAVTGVVAFVRPFSIKVVGLHALTGFAFMALVAAHAANNIRPLKGHLRLKLAWACLGLVTITSVVIWLQPRPVKSLLRLSANTGPALDRFEVKDDGIVYHYSPAPNYRMTLTIRAGANYVPENPPHLAIWLENQGAYHIKTLHAPAPEHADRLPFWRFKREGWEEAKAEAAAAKPADEVDAISGATPNGSFDPADYILPADPDNPMPYRLLIEIDQPGDANAFFGDQPSLVYTVEIDNLVPTTFQVLEISGYPKRDEQPGKEAWELYYVDDQFTTAWELIDSALLTIDRRAP